MTLEVFAPAKINLSLRVGPPCRNGRHPLDSLVVFTKACGDLLSFGPSSYLGLTIDGPFGEGLSAQPDNLVLRAAQLLREFAQPKAGAAIRLHKYLPIASGIGGGSADAAATLVGLNDLWGCGASRAQLQILGASLGADVPACVSGAALHMTGTGEVIEAVAGLPSLGIVLVNPLTPCPTGPVYRQYDQLGSFCDPTVEPLGSLHTVSALLEYLGETPNDLEAAAITLVPKIGDVLGAIATTQNVLLTRMSGSGATCFGLYPTLADAQAAAVGLKNALASFPVWVEADQIN